jgi:hypothetical protein
MCVIDRSTGILMDIILHYWKQGWKFQLAMLIFNICAAVILVPIAWMLNLKLKGSVPFSCALHY